MKASALIVIAVPLMPLSAFSQQFIGTRRLLGFHLGLTTDYLDLTDNERSQVNQVIGSEKSTLIPLIQHPLQKAADPRGCERRRVRSGEINALASQQSHSEKQLNIEKVRIMAQIFSIFTPDQKTQAVSFPSARFGHRKLCQFAAERIEVLIDREWYEACGA